MKSKGIKMIILITISCNVPLMAFTQPDKEPRYYYLSLGTNVYTNTAGSFAEKAFVTVEFGRSFGIFDLGLMFGRLTLAKSDSSYTFELLPTINVFSKGKFSEALTLGAGYIIHAKNNFLTELTNSINYAASNQIVLTIYQGNYFFDGRYSTSKAQFMGISMTYNFISKHSHTERLKKKSLLD